MNSNLKIALSFVSGLAIGAFAMKKFIDYRSTPEYYDDEECLKDDEETLENVEEYDVNEDLEEAFSDKNKNSIKTNTVESNRIDYTKIKSVKDDTYTQLLEELRYSVDKEADENLREQELENIPDPIDTSRPYYIEEEEFESLDDYESDEYTYYIDGYVTDSYGLPVSEEDIENVMGKDFAMYFDKYGGDQIWIRNERLQLDISIIRDIDKFVDVAPPRIRRMVGL